MRIDGKEIARGWARATSSARCRSCLASRRTPTSSRPRQLRVLHLGGPELEGFLRDSPAGDAAHAQDRRPAPAQREPMAELDARPFPPGDYPVVVVGSGPGGMQASYYLRHLGIEHACISADPSPGGMFRRFPFFQRLLSWTKPYGPVPRDDPLLLLVRLELACSPRSRTTARSCPTSWTARRRSRRGRRWSATSPRSSNGPACRSATTRRWESTSRDGERFVLHTPRRRLPLPGRHLRRRRRQAVHARHARLRARRRTTSTRDPRRRTRASACSSWARRTAASSSPPACSSGPSASCSPRRGRPS